MGLDLLHPRLTPMPMPYVTPTLQLQMDMMRDVVLQCKEGDYGTVHSTESKLHHASTTQTNPIHCYSITTVVKFKLLQHPNRMPCQLPILVAHVRCRRCQFWGLYVVSGDMSATSRQMLARHLATLPHFGPRQCRVILVGCGHVGFTYIGYECTVCSGG